MVKVIGSLAEFKSIIESDKISVIDFWATWCGPCKVISPIFEKLESEHSNIDFYNCDVDVQEDVAAEVGIKAMPTFLFFKSGSEIGKVVGADANKLKAALQLHATSS